MITHLCPADQNCVMVIPDLGRSESIPILYMQERLTALLEERKRMGEVPAQKPGSKGALRFGHKVGDTISKALSCHHNAYSHLNGVQQMHAQTTPNRALHGFIGVQRCIIIQIR